MGTNFSRNPLDMERYHAILSENESNIARPNDEIIEDINEQMNAIRSCPGNAVSSIRYLEIANEVYNYIQDSIENDSNGTMDNQANEENIFEGIASSKNIHPNADGHNSLANAVYKDIVEKLMSLENDENESNTDGNHNVDLDITNTASGETTSSASHHPELRNHPPEVFMNGENNQDESNIVEKSQANGSINYHGISVEVYQDIITTLLMLETTGIQSKKPN